MKTGNVVLLSVLFLIIGVIAGSWIIKNKYTCYYLPKHGSPDSWGKYYWGALHSTIEKIPCSICRNEASEMMKAMHDTVNLRLEKPLYDKDNLKKWLDKYSEIRTRLNNEN